MDNFDLIHQGAEAKLYRGSYLGKTAIVKQRFEKKYRHPDINQHLTKERMKAECRAIVRCKSAGILTPTLYYIDFKKHSIYMEYFKHSITVKDFIQQASPSLIEKVTHNIGIVLAKMHANNIIHGDLTTSNILLVNKNNKENFFDNILDLDIVLIDFGLAHIDASAEDKGVDLYVLERAIISIHDNPDTIFQFILKAYENEYKKGFIEVLLKLTEVRSRGRKRTMVG